ncbi:hypothetical protein GCM10027290_66660 [Micromonospora sonneratiae]|uniref:Uncharacterized protein n=1 Tax=Micromonospora sonneratiae TaxID=1184706 RepID=A0ABW3YSA7_9ACTN
MTEARTIAEAYVHLELTLPEGEDWVDYRRYTTLHDVDDEHWLLRFDGPYEGQWHVAEVVVSKTGARAAQEAGQWYGVDRSTLVDAGQWYAIEAACVGMAQTGLDQLGGEPPDEETYWAIVEAWAGAAAAAGEIEKFLPPGVEEVPATAFWTEHGRRVRGQRRDAFRRSRLTGDAAFYLRRRDDFQLSFAPLFDGPAGIPEVSAVGPAEVVDASPAGSAEPSAAGSAEPSPGGPVDVPLRELVDASTSPLPARTYGEVHAYLDMHPCQCGAVQFPRGQMSVLASDERGVVVHYAGPCDECGQPREHTFRLPQRPGLPPGEPYRFSYVGDGPSELLDPGEWVAVSQAYGAVADAVAEAMAAEPGDPDPAERTAAVEMLTMAVNALDEAAKFFPPDAETLPTSAFWTANGHDVRRSAPEWFERRHLAEQRFKRWQQLTGFTARYGR